MRTLAFDSLSDGIALVDAKWNVQYANAACGQMLNLKIERIVNQPLSKLMPDAQSWFNATKLSAQRKPTSGKVVWHRPAKGDARQLNISILPAPVVSSGGSCYLVKMREPQNFDSLDEEIENLRTKMFWRSRLETEIEISKRSGSPITVLMLAFDDAKRDFRAPSEPCGFFLRHIVAMAHLECRLGDMLCLYEPEILGLALYETHISEGLAIGERIRSEIAGSGLDHLPLKMSVSLGAAGWSGPTDTEPVLLEHALSSLTKAQEDGGNQMRLFMGKGKGKIEKVVTHMDVAEELKKMKIG